MELKGNHSLIKEYLLEVTRQSGLGNLHTAMSWVSLIRPEILSHFAKEETRLTDIIAKEPRSIDREKVMDLLREHKELARFMTVKLPYLTELNPTGAKEEFDEFVVKLKRQMEEEEAEAFPEVYAAGLTQAKRKLSGEIAPTLQISRSSSMRGSRNVQRTR